MDNLDRSILDLLRQNARAGYGDIGSELRIPVGSIGPTRARALTRLRAALETAGVHDVALN